MTRLFRTACLLMSISTLAACSEAETHAWLQAFSAFGAQ